MKTRILLKIVNDRRTANMVIDFPSEELAVESIRAALPVLRPPGSIFVAAQMEFDLQLDGVTIQKGVLTV